MAWYNSIIGGATTSAAMNATTPSTGLAGSIVAVNGLGSAPYWAAQNTQTTILTHQNTMYVVKQYADAIGWSLTHHHLPAGVTSDDPKIAILKITSIGQVLKDVGVRTSDTDFYVMRDPND
jgi:hypothetical protein